MPARHDLSLYQGDSWSAQFAFQHADGSPYDLTGMTFVSQIRDGYADGAATPVNVTLAVAANVVTASLTSTQTQALTGQRYEWDLESTKGFDRVTWVAGSVYVAAEVTRTPPLP